MSTPQPPAEGRTPSPPSYRARAYVASLLSELTGQGDATDIHRNDPPEPRLLAEPADQRRPQDGRPAHERSGRPPGGAEGPVGDDEPADPVQQPEPDRGPDAGTDPGAGEDEVPTVQTLTQQTPTEQTPTEQAPTEQALTEQALAEQALAERPVMGRPAVPLTDLPRAAADRQPAADPQPAAEDVQPVREPGPSWAAAAPAPAQLATRDESAPVPASGPGQHAAPSAEPRPAPFTYAMVARHHTGPARATADGALDQAGQRINSRADRALARRAALVTMEALSLLDACDRLDGRAEAVDATWNGEHHSPTSVREFEGAWGAFHDAQVALDQHVA